jgi:hypothetical protein
MLEAKTELFEPPFFHESIALSQSIEVRYAKTGKAGKAKKINCDDPGEFTRKKLDITGRSVGQPQLKNGWGS